MLPLSGAALNDLWYGLCAPVAKGFLSPLAAGRQNLICTSVSAGMVFFKVLTLAALALSSVHGEATATTTTAPACGMGGQPACKPPFAGVPSTAQPRGTISLSRILVSFCFRVDQCIVDA